MKPLLTLGYDGTAYAGWQRQKNALAIQQVVEEALCKLLKTDAAVIGGGRTDAGVHALGQRALIIKPARIFIPTERLPAALNTLLPADIKVLSAEQVADDFHPLRHKSRKTYEYSVYNAPVMPPIHRLYAALWRGALDVGAMREAGAHFVGVHDFAGFCGTNGTAATTIREIFDLDITQNGPLIRISVCGNGFLYNMVRIIAGTLMMVGQSRITPSEIPGIIRSRDRTMAGDTMPPCGLMLKEIKYVT